MTLLKREAVLNTVDLLTTDVAVPEWGGTIRIRQMTVAERGEFVRRTTGDGAALAGAWMVAALVVDENGAPVFKPEDVAALEKRSYKVMDRIVGEILKLNRLNEDTVSDAEKNS